MIRTSFYGRSEDEPRLARAEAESYRVVGGATTLDQSQIKEAMLKCCGLFRQWDCLNKAKIARAMFGGYIAVGSLSLLSSTYGSTFGYAYNPPLEFHAWVVLQDWDILDLALPGAVERGSELRDDYGPFLYGREPVIVYGTPEYWMDYKMYERIL